MEMVSGILSDILVSKDIIKDEDRDFYRYSIESTILYLINFLTIFILAAITGNICKCIIFLIVFYPLRTSCGGVHMKTWYSCYVVSCAIIEVILLISSRFCIKYSMLIIGLAICIICIWKLAPYVHILHPMDEESINKSRFKARKNSILVSFMAIIFMVLEMNITAMLCYLAVCLCTMSLLMGYIVDKITNRIKKII